MKRRVVRFTFTACLAVMTLLAWPIVSSAAESQTPGATEAQWQRLEEGLDAILQEQAEILKELERVLEEARIVKIRATR